MTSLTLISHHLCPYVQRAVIALTEKQVQHKKIYVDLSNKPDWFIALSPLGKTPVLKVGDTAVFESSVILEYLEETQPHPLHPSNPLLRAEHRSWIEYGSAMLNDIAGLYGAANKTQFDSKLDAIALKVLRIENRLNNGPWFEGESFSLVDAAFGPVLRYFDVFDQIQDFGIFTPAPKVRHWRAMLAKRPSIKFAVTDDYNSRLHQFLATRKSHITTLLV